MLVVDDEPEVCRLIQRHLGREGYEVRVAGSGAAMRQALTEASVDLGQRITHMAKETMAPYAMQSYGKASIVGVNGEQQHGSAMVTTASACSVGWRRRSRNSLSWTNLRPWASASERWGWR